MASQELQEIIERAELLPAEEQLRLIAHLAERTANVMGEKQQHYSWLDLEGAAPYPLLGEDAQAWVSRTRRESDQARARQWNKPA